MRRGRVKQSNVNFKALDGGYGEWFKHFWAPLVEASNPPTHKKKRFKSPGKLGLGLL